jgi:hypothetical protein
MQRIRTCKRTRNVFDICLAIAFGLECCLLFVGLYLLLLISRANLIVLWVLRCQHHEAHAKNSIGAGGKDFYL